MRIVKFIGVCLFAVTFFGVVHAKSSGGGIVIQCSGVGCTSY